jgi:murein DD-endopeptidase MepM/ murein hydrolase activator NlpD
LRVVIVGSLLAIGSLTAVHPDPSRAADADQEAEHQRQRDRNVQAARELDPVTATTEQLFAAVTVLNTQVESQRARSTESDREQRDAERRLAEHREALGVLQPELQKISNGLRLQAVRMYTDPEQSDNSLRLMRAEKYDDAERRRVYDDEVNGDSQKELIEKIRVARVRQDKLQADANDARDQAQLRQREREQLFQELVANQDALTRLRTEWDKRTNGLTKNNEGAGDRNALDRAIAEQKAKLGPAAPVPLSSNGRMIRPCGGKVNDPFGYLKARGRMHEGVDLAGATGTPVAAAQSGRVVFTGWDGAYGNTVVIEHSPTLETRYAHLSKINVRSGATVNQGYIIGNIGATGQVTGPHLHFEVILRGTQVDPKDYIPL